MRLVAQSPMTIYKAQFSAGQAARGSAHNVGTRKEAGFYDPNAKSEQVVQGRSFVYVE